MVDRRKGSLCQSSGGASWWHADRRMHGRANICFALAEDNLWLRHLSRLAPTFLKAKGPAVVDLQGRRLLVTEEFSVQTRKLA